VGIGEATVGKSWLGAVVVVGLAGGTLGAPSSAAAQPGGDRSSAQPRPGSPESQFRETGIEEIIVTGRKRSELLQRAPLSITARTGLELEAAAADTLDEIDRTIPNLQLDASTGSQTDARIYIRGIGQDNPTDRVDPGVGLYVDGVYLPRIQAGLLSLLDVDRIEVLRGPQGTLYGKNTIGGVVNVVTRRPTDALGGVASVSLGSQGRVQTRLTVNAPVDALQGSVRASLLTRTADGYQKNKATGDRAGDDKLLAARVAWSFVPNDTLQIDLSADRSREHEKTLVGECRIGNRLSLGAFAVDNFVDEPDFVSACQESRESSPFDVFSKRQNARALDVFGLVGSLRWDLGPVDLTSITSWRRRDERARGGDNDNTRADFILVGVGETTDHTSYSQELRLHGTALEGALEFVAGVYAFEEESETEAEGAVLRQLALNPDTPTRGDLSRDPVARALAQAGIDVSTFTGVDRAAKLLLSGDASPGPGPLSQRVSNLNRRSSRELENRSFAGFVDVSYALSERLSLSTGARYTAERKQRQGWSGPVFPELGGGVTMGVPLSKRFGRWTPRLSVSYLAQPNLLVYASASRGFKSGGFNSTAVRPEDRAAATTFDPEELDSYEIGLKGRWFERRLSVDLSAFYGRYRDIQLTSQEIRESDGTLATNIRNAARATVRGFELELRARPLPGLTLQGAVGVTDAKYQEFRDLAVSPPANPGGCVNTVLSECGVANVIALLNGGLLEPSAAAVDKSDLEFKHTPAFGYSLSARYELDVARLGRVSAQASWSQRDRVFFDIDNTESIAQAAYGLLDLKLSLTLADPRTQISVFAKNLLDRRYLAGGFSVQDVVSADSVFYGPPRTWGVELRLEF